MMIRLIFIPSLIMIFFALNSSGAEVESKYNFFESASSVLYVYDRPLNKINENCKSNNIKDSVCEEFLKGQLTKSDFIFDCKIKNDECVSGEQLFVNDVGLRYRYISYFHFDTSKECSDIDHNNEDQTFAENAQLIFINGINQNFSLNKIREQISRYLATPYSNGEGGKISRLHCLKSKKGWVLDNYLQKSSINFHPSFQETEVSKCNECSADEIKRKNNKKLKDKVRDFLKRAESELNILQQANYANIRDCDGEVKFPNIQTTFSKVASTKNLKGSKINTFECKAKFQNCGSGAVGNLELIEQISNGIFLAHGSYSKVNAKACHQVVNSYIESCGLNKGLARGGSLTKFSEIRKKLSDILKNERKNYKISEGTMMCIMNVETLNLDGSKVAWDGCGPRNLNNIRKPGFNDPDDFIFKGHISSASGLGQVTLETACYTIQRFPEYYGDLSLKIKNIRCSSPEAKKIVENYFITAGQSEYMQILLAIDTLKMKMSEAPSLSQAIKNYGDFRNPTYTPFVEQCSKCFGPKVSDEDAMNCAAAKRRLYYKPPVKEDADEDGSFPQNEAKQRAVPEVNNENT